jgi:hypothetical protein
MKGCGSFQAPAAAVQHQPRLAVGADVVPVQLFLEIARKGRLLVAELRGDRAAGQQDDVAIARIDGGKVGAEQADIVDPGNAAGRVGMMDERQVGMRIERVDVAAGGALGDVAHIGVLRALEQVGGRRVAAVLDIKPGDRLRPRRRPARGRFQSGSTGSGRGLASSPLHGSVVHGGAFSAHFMALRFGETMRCRKAHIVLSWEACCPRQQQYRENA